MIWKAWKHHNIINQQKKSQENSLEILEAAKTHCHCQHKGLWSSAAKGSDQSSSSTKGSGDLNHNQPKNQSMIISKRI
jgi:hypothetical protein